MNFLNIASEKLIKLAEMGKQVIGENTQAVAFGITCVSLLYFMKKKKPEEKKPPALRKLQRSNSANRKEPVGDKEAVLKDLKRSQRRLNKRLNKCDDTLDLSSDIYIPRSPDHSVVFDVDQRLFTDLFPNKQKLKKGGYQTDYESDTQISFLKYTKQQKKQFKEYENKEQNTEDKLFFRLHGQVAESNEEDD